MTVVALCKCVQNIDQTDDVLNDLYDGDELPQEPKLLTESIVAVHKKVYHSVSETRNKPLPTDYRVHVVPGQDGCRCVMVVMKI